MAETLSRLKYCSKNMMPFPSQVFFCTRPFRSECETWHRNVEIFPGVWHRGPGRRRQTKEESFLFQTRRIYRWENSDPRRRGWCAHALCRSPLPLHKAHHYHQQVHIVAALFEDLLSAAQREGPRPFLCNPQHFTHSLSPPPKSPPIYFLFLAVPYIYMGIFIWATFV